MITDDNKCLLGQKEKTYKHQTVSHLKHRYGRTLNESSRCVVNLLQDRMLPVEDTATTICCHKALLLSFQKSKDVRVYDLKINFLVQTSAMGDRYKVRSRGRCSVAILRLEAEGWLGPGAKTRPVAAPVGGGRAATAQSPPGGYLMGVKH